MAIGFCSDGHLAIPKVGIGIPMGHIGHFNRLIFPYIVHASVGVKILVDLLVLQMEGSILAGFVHESGVDSIVVPSFVLIVDGGYVCCGDEYRSVRAELTVHREYGEPIVLVSIPDFDIRETKFLKKPHRRFKKT